jgi:inosose dehydratase
MKRREFFLRAGALGLASPLLFGEVPRGGGALPNPVGYATIAWPEEEFEHGLATISKLGFRGVQLLGWVRERWGGERTAEFAAMLEKLRLKPVALSCWGVQLAPEGSPEDEKNFRSYAELFERLGGLYLQVTDGGQPDREYSEETIRSLGARMNHLGRIARDHGLTLGYHPHFNNLGETREGLARVLEATDPSLVKLIADVGHLRLGGSDPAEVIRAYGERLIFLHLKDIRNDLGELLGKDREAIRKREFHFCEIGTGLVDFSAIVRALQDVKFRGWVIVELDGNEPSPGGPDESARKNLEAVRRLGFKV